MSTVQTQGPAGGVSVHADLMGLAADDHLQYLLLAGRAGGQSVFGGTSGGGDLMLQGRDDSVLGLINVNSPMVFGPYAPSGQVYAFQYNATEGFGSNFIGGGLNMSGNLTFQQSLFIYESFRGSPTINTSAVPGFAAYTILQALPAMIAGINVNENPLAPLVLNAGPRVTNPWAGTRTTSSIAAINFSPTINPAVNGATMNVTSVTGLTFLPVWNTVSGSNANFGTMRAVFARNPAQALFGQSLGTERGLAYYGLDVENITLNNGFGTMPRVAVRSAQATGTNAWFLLNIGTANSSFNGTHIFNVGITQHFGDGTLFSSSYGAGGGDVIQYWDGSALIFNPIIGENLGFAFGLDGAKPTYLFEAETFGVSEINYTQIRFGFDRYAFGQAGAIGNQVGLFVAGGRTVDVAGGWSDFLLTQGGNLNIGTFAMSDVAAWTINLIALDNTAGSIASLDTFVVGGMTTSNPGITVTERSALRSTGRFKQRGTVQFPPINPSALGAGNVNDWAGLLTGSPNNNGRYWARVTGNATTSTLTGIDSTAVQDGDTFEMTNVGAENILIVSEDAGSVAGNRILTEDGFNHVLKPDGTATIRYDSTTSRWRVTTPAGNVAPLTGFWKFSTTTTMADPGSGTFRVNNATPASVTSVAINDISFRGGDLSPVLDLLGAGDVLYMSQTSNGSNFIKLNITGVTDNGTWFQVDGTVGNSGTLFGNNQECAITAIFA